MSKGRKPQTIPSTAAALQAVPKPPSYLAPAAKKEWKKVAPILVERGTLTDADLGMLEGYCTAHARVVEAERTIRAEGATYLGASGPKRHPAVSTQDALLKTMRLFAGELGLTPVSRSKSSLPAGEAQLDDLDADLDV